MPTAAETLYKDYPSLDPTVILALAQDVPDWDEREESEAALRAMLNDLNTSAETEAALATLELSNGPEEPAISTTTGEEGTGDATSGEQAGPDFDWPEELQFLSQVCPGKPQSVLIRALRQNTGDIEDALNQISAEEFFNSDVSSSSASGAADTTKPGPGQTPSQLPSRKVKRRKEPKKTTFSLTSTPKGPLSSSAPPSQNGQDAADELAGNGTDREATLAHLAALMDTSLQTVDSTFTKQRESFVLTIEALLDSFERSRPFDKLTFEPPLHEQIDNNGTEKQEENSKTALEAHPVIVVLLSLFPDQQDLSLWRRLLCGSNGHLEAAVDLHMVQKRLTKQHGSALQASLLQAAADPARFNINPLTSSSALRKGWADVGGRKPEAPVTWIDVSPESPMSYAAATHEGPAAHSRLSQKECESRAQEYRDKRNAAYKSASEAFAKGKHNQGPKGQGMRAAAAFLAERGRELDALARKWDSAAAQSLVSERQARSMDRFTIDLHNLTVNQALETTKSSLSNWWASTNAESKPFTIITGRGSHSARHTPLILPAVEKMLKRDGWRYSTDRHQGQIIVKGTTR